MILKEDLKKMQKRDWGKDPNNNNLYQTIKEKCFCKITKSYIPNKYYLDKHRHKNLHSTNICS